MCLAICRTLAVDRLDADEAVHAFIVSGKAVSGLPLRYARDLNVDGLVRLAAGLRQSGRSVLQWLKQCHIANDPKSLR